MTNPDGQAGMFTGVFTVTSSPAAPKVTSITPDSGVNGTSVSVTDLHGSNFVTGATVKLARSGMGDIVATGVTVDGTVDQITCTLPIPSGAATGAWIVVVTNPDTLSGTLTEGFTVTSPPVAAPTVASITPTKHRHGGKAFLATITGSAFQPGVTGTNAILWKIAH